MPWNCLSTNPRLKNGQAGLSTYKVRTFMGVGFPGLSYEASFRLIPFCEPQHPHLVCLHVFSFGKRLCWWHLTVFYLLSSAASLTVDISEMKEDQGAVLSRL